MKDAQLCPTFCNLMDCSPPGSSVHGILLARILEWVAMSSSRGLSLIPPALAGRFFTTSVTWETLYAQQIFPVQFSSVTQSCLTLCNPIDCCSPGFPVHHQLLLKLMSIESMMPSNHLILCPTLLLPPSIFPSIKVFSNESVLHIRWPKD